METKLEIINDFTKYAGLTIDEEGKIIKGNELWDLPKDFTFFKDTSLYPLDSSISTCRGLQYLDYYLSLLYPISIESVNVFEKNKGSSQYYSNSFSLTSSIGSPLPSLVEGHSIVDKGFTLKGIRIPNLRRLPLRLKPFMKVFEVSEDLPVSEKNLKLTPSCVII